MISPKLMAKAAQTDFPNPFPLLKKVTKDRAKMGKFIMRRKFAVSATMD